MMDKYFNKKGKDEEKPKCVFFLLLFSLFSFFLRGEEVIILILDD